MKADQILDFWFQELTPKDWWQKDLAFDQMISQRFKEVHQAANHGELYLWRKTAKGRLAEIIVLDQFSRNMYRELPQSFASDSLALVLAQEAISLAADKALSAVERSFLYMPFMHSESLLIHNVALDLYRENGIESNYNFEVKHRDIIEQFGRYPHRNEILGRTSTNEEIEFLSTPGSSF